MDNTHYGFDSNYNADDDPMPSWLLALAIIVVIVCAGFFGVFS